MEKPEAEETERTEKTAEAEEHEEPPTEESETAGELKETEEISTEEAEEPAEEEITEEVKEEVEEEEKPEIVEERIYTIPLSRAWIAPRRKRAPRAVRLVRSYIERHMKVGATPEEEGEAERLVISNEVNEKLWSRGIQKPPRRVRVRVAKDVEGTITVYLAEGD
ncbi:MAG: 50S ribosomal protein L31e [Candidatus Bathyarchaeia archaeon]